MVLKADLEKKIKKLKKELKSKKEELLETLVFCYGYLLEKSEGQAHELTVEQYGYDNNACSIEDVKEQLKVLIEELNK